MKSIPSALAKAPVLATVVRRRLPAAARTAALTVGLLILTSCAQWQGGTATLQQRVHEIGCTSECQKVKDQCDDHARFAYRQCEDGYGSAQRDFLWCNSSSADECGYPWWSCSENLYGYCTNRFNECARSCRRGAYATGRDRGPARP